MAAPERLYVEEVVALDGQEAGELDEPQEAAQDDDEGPVLARDELQEAVLYAPQAHGDRGRISDIRGHHNAFPHVDHGIQAAPVQKMQSKVHLTLKE